MSTEKPKQLDHQADRIEADFLGDIEYCLPLPNLDLTTPFNQDANLDLETAEKIYRFSEFCDPIVIDEKGKPHRPA